MQDIKAAKDKLKKYVTDSGKRTVTVMSKPCHEETDQSTLICFRQQRSAGVYAYGADLKAAATKFAGLHEAADFKVSKDWLFQFKI